MFRRRDQPTLGRRLRESVWPRAGWRRAWRYLVFRLCRLRGSPQQVALGFSCGAFMAFTPLFGLQYLTSIAAAWFLRGNLIAAFLGANLGFLYPFVLFWTYDLGKLILGTRAVAVPAGRGLEPMLKDFWNLFLPILVGSIPVGLCVGLASFTLVYWAVTAYRRWRERRLATSPRRTPASATEEFHP